MIPKNVWISIEDKLPEQEGLYLTYTPSGNVRQALFDKDQCWRPSGSNRVPPQLNLDVSHWMDLPLPPGSSEDQRCIPTSSKAQIRNLLTPCLTLASIILEDPQYEGLPECANQVNTSVNNILKILDESPTGNLDNIKKESLAMICGLCCRINPHHAANVSSCRCSDTEFLRGT